jgi:pimeloyl-ACP methyl ester carboxylesterase
VLDDAQVDKGILYGTSYGTYIAAGLGVQHPDRLQAMILDSPLLSNHDIETVRDAIRSLLWDGDEPDAIELAPKVRQLVDDGVLTPAASLLAAAVYGFGGASLLGRQLDLLLRGRRGLWTVIGRMARFVVGRKAPYRNEVDLVGRIGYRELNYCAVPDGKPLDPAVAFRAFASNVTDFEAEPYDLVTEMPKFGWPTVVVSGGRDLTTPPAVAERIASLVPDAVLVSLLTAPHSVLDTRERAALDIAKAVRDGRIADLPRRASALDALPGRPAIRLLVSAIRAAAAVEAALPSVVPRVATS